MKRLLAATLLLIPIGCAAPPEPEPGPPPLPPPTNTVQREIDAASELPFQRDRRERLKAVAQQPNLDVDTQLRLVERAFYTLPDDEDLEAVLITLIDNPSFKPATRDRIRADLARFTFPDAQSRIETALARRGPLDG